MVTWAQLCREPLEARESEDGCLRLAASSLVCHARTLTWFAFFSKFFQEKRDCSQPTHHHKALLISNPIKSVHASSFPDLLKSGNEIMAYHAWGNTRGMCSTQQNPFFFSHIDLLVPTIEPNSPLNLMLNFIILQCNPTRMLRNFGPKQPKLQNRPKVASHVGLLYNCLQPPNK